MSAANEIQRLQQAKADIKSAIEEKGVTVGDGRIDTYAEKISEISVGGSGDNPLEYATNYTGLYRDSVFPDGYELNVNLPYCVTVQYFINNAQGIKKLVLSGNTQGNVLSFTYFANKCSTIEEIDLSNFNAKVESFNNPFNNATNLKTIKGELDLTECEMISTNPFANCTSLVDISFKANSISLSLNMSQCINLSNASIQSIIDGLADLSGEEQYIIAGPQNGPDTFSYPDEEVVIPTEEIHQVNVKDSYWMDNGAIVYIVVYGSQDVEVTAYKKKAAAGEPQTLTLHATVGSKLTDEQKATITTKNWELVY